MAEHIKIRKAQGRWSVRVGGAVMVESSAALELSEGDYPEVIYFPRSDIAMALLDQTDKSTHCPHKGDATCFSVVGRSQTFENAAWSYENPKSDVSQIKDHIAFYAGNGITVEQL
jgi:uncharacterized protein (DUF427 family)